MSPSQTCPAGGIGVNCISHNETGKKLRRKKGESMGLKLRPENLLHEKVAWMINTGRNLGTLLLGSFTS